MKTSQRRKKVAYELSTLGETQFDVIDKFDMFNNPHDVEELTEQDQDNLNELYGVSLPTHLLFSIVITLNLTQLSLCCRVKNIQTARPSLTMLAAAMSTIISAMSAHFSTYLFVITILVRRSRRFL